ncbi:MAG: tetratricopeptide repeat protein [Lachnospiraceae bacterium]|nr:tetratricopeptide repeat protein [Lachnospiraceae bacterium]
MRCYRCGAVLTENEFCTNCGADVRIYRRIIRLSNMYYNDGLQKAQVRDLSGAVESLLQSLKCNRNNVDARNLLGLVYFEMGEAVAALSEWIVSKNLKPEKNIADDFIEEVESNPTRLSAINQSLKKYNQALSYCEQKSYDLAIIQLKKVVQSNPNLIVAYQLLGLLYLESKDYEKAARILERGIRIDKNNTTMLNYLKEAEDQLGERDGLQVSSLQKKAPTTHAASDSIVYQSGNETIIQPINMPEKVSMSAVVNILIGLGIGLAVMWFLVLPARIRSAQTNANDELMEVSNELTARSADIDALNKQIASLQQENEAASQAIESLTSGSGIVEKYDYLAEAALNFIRSPNDVTTTAEMLARVMGDSFSVSQGSSAEENYSAAFRSLYDYLNTQVTDEAAKRLLDSGIAAYNNGDFNQAAADLENAYQLDETNDQALFYLASSYRSAGDSDRATELFSLLINTFPDSEYVQQARTYLQNGAESDRTDAGAQAAPPQEVQDPQAAALAAFAAAQAQAAEEAQRAMQGLPADSDVSAGAAIDQ